MFFVRQNEATSRSIVLNTLALAYIETPLISKQDKPKIGQEKKVQERWVERRREPAILD